MAKATTPAQRKLAQMHHTIEHEDEIMAKLEERKAKQDQQFEGLSEMGTNLSSVLKMNTQECIKDTERVLAGMTDPSERLRAPVQIF